MWQVYYDGESIKCPYCGQKVIKKRTEIVFLICENTKCSGHREKWKVPLIKLIDFDEPEPESEEEGEEEDRYDDLGDEGQANWVAFESKEEREKWKNEHQVKIKQ